MEITIVPAKALRGLLTLTALLVALSLLGQVVVIYLPDFPGRDISAKFFDVGREQSLPTLYSSLMFLVAGVLFWQITAIRARAKQPLAGRWAALGVLSLLLALDEFLSFHERMTPLLRALFDLRGGLLFRYAWVIAGVALVGIVAVAFVPFLKHLPALTRRQLLGAAILYIAGAVGLELLGGIVAAEHGRSTMAFVLVVTAEETFEMMGSAGLIYALLVYTSNELPGARWDLRIRG